MTGMLKDYNDLPMPNRYFHWIDAQPAGAVTSSGAGH